MGRRIAIVGAGPRGLATLERAVENALAAGETGVSIAVFDDTRPGTGRVWRPDQAHQLLMNTVTSQTTMFTDDSVDCQGPVRPGPSMYEWLVEGLASHVDDIALRTEMAMLGPNDYPSRALYGHYLLWCLDRVLARASGQVDVQLRTERITRVRRAAGRWELTARGGGRHRADSVVLTLGHLPGEASASDALTSFAALHGLTYLPPANPADIDTSSIPAGRPVILRGLGLCFFDYLGLFTTARGGRFTRRDGRLTYVPSGREPILVAGCRRGVPHHARGANEKGVAERHLPRFLTPQVIARAQARAAEGRPVDFHAEIWPLIQAEVEYVYVAAKVPDVDRSALLATLLQSPAVKARQLAELGLPPAQQFDWHRILHPAATAPTRSLDDYRRWLLDYLRRDVRLANEGNVTNPLKAAVDVLRDLRNEVRQVIDHGVVSAHSYREHVARTYTPDNAFLSIGPPAARIEELHALIQAGTVTVVGPGMRVDPTHTGEFAAYSPLIPDSARRASVLIEARLPEPSSQATSDPLVRDLVEHSVARLHTLDQGFTRYSTGAIDVSPQPYRVLDRYGRPHLDLFAFGVPTEGVHWATAAGVRPGVGSVILSDADAVARAALGLDSRSTVGDVEVPA